jgi:hypothetical protein
MSNLKNTLARDFGIGHVTIELEDEAGQCAGSSCDLVPVGLGSNSRHLGHQH